MATPQSFFSDVVTHRFRLRPLTPVGRQRHARHGGIHDRRHLRGCAGRDVGAEREHRHIGRARGELRRRQTVRSRTACASSRDWSATRSSWMSRPRSARIISGKLSFDTAGANTVQFRDVLSIVVEVPFAPIVERFDGVTLIAAIAENVVTRRGKPIRIERLGRPEIKNVIMANPMRDPRTRGVELRDLYNREDAFALSREYRPLYESRLDANLAFFDGLDGKTAWPLGAGRAPSVTRSAHRRFLDPRSRARIRARKLPRDRTRADRQPAARERGRSLARRRHSRRAAHAARERRARRAVRRRRRRSHQAGQPVVPLRA